MTTAVRRFIHRLRYGAAEEHSVMILGLDNAGKTTLLYLLKLGEVVTTIPTLGFQVESVDLGVVTQSGKPLRLAVWETDGGGCGGSRFLKHLLPIYLANSEAVVWVVDMSDDERLVESAELLKDVLGVVDQNDGNNVKIKSDRFPVLILANKSDHPKALKLDEISAAFSEATSGRLSAIFKTSLTSKPNANGLAEAFEWLNSAFDASKEYYLTVPQTSPSNASSIPDHHSPIDLAQKLESWIAMSEDHTNELSDDEFLARFYSFDLPKWDHYTHIRLAYLILTKYGRKDGKDMIFKGLEAYIAASPDTKGKTFHLSMSYFWIQIVHFGIMNIPEVSNKTDLDDQMKQPSTSGSGLQPFSEFLLINPHVVDGNLWSEYYSKSVLMTPQARAEMVLPDKKPLPNLVPRDAIRTVGLSSSRPTFNVNI